MIIDCNQKIFQFQTKNPRTIAAGFTCGELVESNDGDVSSDASGLNGLLKGEKNRAATVRERRTLKILAFWTAKTYNMFR